MQGYLTPAAYQDWLSDLSSRAVWAGLCNTNPAGRDVPSSAEVSGPSYSRIRIDWSISAAVLVSTNPLPFLGFIGPIAAVAVGIFDAEVNSNLLAVCYLPSPAAIVTASYTVAPGMVIGFDL